MSGGNGSVFSFYRGKIDQKVRIQEHRLATPDDARSHSKEWHAFRNSEDERKNGHPLDPVFFQSPPPVAPLDYEVQDQVLDVKERKRPTL